MHTDLQPVVIIFVDEVNCVVKDGEENFHLVYARRWGRRVGRRRRRFRCCAGARTGGGGIRVVTETCRRCRNQRFVLVPEGEAGEVTSGVDIAAALDGRADALVDACCHGGCGG